MVNKFKRNYFLLISLFSVIFIYKEITFGIVVIIEGQKFGQKFHLTYVADL